MHFPLTVRRTLLGLLLALVWLLLAGARPELQVDAQPRELQAHDTLRLEILLDQEATGQGGMVASPNVNLPPLQDFDILDQQSSSSMMQSGTRMRMRVQARYLLKPRYSGNLTIPSLSFSYSENGQAQTVASQPILIRVTGGRFLSWLPLALPFVFVLGVIGLLVGLGGWFWLRRRLPAPVLPSEKAEAAEPPPPFYLPAVPPHPLDPLRQRLEQGEAPATVLESLYAWVRERLLRQAGLTQPGLTHAELLEGLRFQAGLPAQQLAEIRALLQNYERLRFSGSPLQAEQVLQLLQQARESVNLSH
ncbi:MAG: BatD family protein [Candidatus Sericytochromatia bacterium]